MTREALYDIYKKKLGNFTAALSTQDKYAIKKSIKGVLQVLRLLAQKDLDKFNQLCDRRAALERLDSKGKAAGVTNLLLAKDIKILNKTIKAIRDMLVWHGNEFTIFLDAWESSGATIGEFLDFVGAEPAKRREILEDLETEPMSFSGIAFVYHADHNHYTGKVIEYDEFAPITHCLIEYHCALMRKATISNPDLKTQIREEMFELFPGIEGNAFTDDQIGE